MAVYTQQVDPQSFQTTGYQLPVNQIIQAVATRNAYWDMGASQLKNAQQKYLNLSLTLDKNKEQLTSLSKGVDASLQRAAQADLSIAPNVHDAMRSFDPIVKNENIMGDHAITSHYQKEMQRAEGLRNQEGGKYYSPINARDLQIGLDKFAKSGDPASWREHYAQRRKYQDYYDVQAEIKELRRTFVPSVTSKTIPGIDPKTGQGNSLYMTTTVDKSQTEGQWKAYLSANLSEKARNQLNLEGRVAFYEREPELVRAYASYTNDKITSLKKQRNVLQGAYDAIKKDLTPEMDQLYKDQFKDFDLNIEDLSAEKTKLENGDPSTLANNQDGIAGLIYADSYISNVARSLQNINAEVTIKPDMARLTILKEDYANYRAELQVSSRERIAQAQLAMEQLKISMKAQEQKYDPKFALEWDLGILSSGPENERTITKALYDNALKNYSEDLKSKKQNLYQFFEKHDPTFASKDQAARESFIDAWASNPDNRALPVYRDFKNSHDMYNNQKVIRDAILKDAEADARKDYPSVFKDVQANSVNVPVVNGTGKIENLKLTGDDIKQLAMGTSTRVIMTPLKTVGGRVVDETEINVDGVTYKVPIDALAPLNSELDRVRKLTGGQLDKIREAVDRKVTESLYIQKPRADQKQQYQMVLANQDFAREFGIPSEAASNISVYGRNQFGTYYNFTEVDEKKMGGLTKEKLINNVTAKGGDVYTLEGRDILMVPHTAGVGINDQFYTEPKLRPVEDYFNYYRAGTKDTTVTTPAGINYEPGDTGQAFGFTMMVSNGVPTYYPVYLGPNPVGKGKLIRNGQEGFSSLGAAAKFLQTNFSDSKNFDQALSGY